MSRKPLSDEQFEALLGSLDVAARQVLLGPEVDRARVALGDALLAEINSGATIGAAVISSAASTASSGSTRARTLPGALAVERRAP
jgi:hypothetical protein